MKLNLAAAYLCAFSAFQAGLGHDIFFLVGGSIFAVLNLIAAKGHLLKQNEQPTR